LVSIRRRPAYSTNIPSLCWFRYGGGPPTQPTGGGHLDKVQTRGYDWLPGALLKHASQGFDCPAN